MVMKRIAMISEHASPLAGPGSVDSGGQNVYVAQVARHLNTLGYQVDVFTRRDRPDLPEILEWDNGVRIIHVPAGPAEFVRKEDLLQYMPAFTDYMAGFIQRPDFAPRTSDFAGRTPDFAPRTSDFSPRTSEILPYDLIHANFWMSGLVAAELKRRLGLPFVITFHALGRVRRIHQGKADGFPTQRLEIEDRIVSEADAIIAECPQDEEDLIHLYNALPEQITIIPCGFDPAELWPIEKPAARKLLRLPAREFLILQLGRMVPRKGVDNVVEALALLKQQHHLSARLVIAGGETQDPDPLKTPEIARLQVLAQGLGVADRIKFVGRQDRQSLKYYYSAADVFVSTPWYEPFGITPVESMACGTPVIGANVGGIRYTVRHAETGFLVPARDPETLARRLAQLIQEPELRACLGQQSIQRANELFTWKKVADKVAELYERVLVQVSPAYQPENDPLNVILRGFEQSQQAIQQAGSELAMPLLQVAEAIVACLARGGKLMVCGNGGSAAESQHFAAELMGRYKIGTRRGIPVIALTADSSFLTAWTNDTGYDLVFARQVETLGQPGDLLLGISTSGRSRNVIEAFKTARHLGIGCVALLGRDGGDLLPLTDAALVVPSTDTPRIQEVQLLMLHLLAELTEARLVAEQRFLSEALLPTGVASGLGGAVEVDLGVRPAALGSTAAGSVTTLGGPATMGSAASAASTVPTPRWSLAPASPPGLGSAAAGGGASRRRAPASSTAPSKGKAPAKGAPVVKSTSVPARPASPRSRVPAPSRPAEKKSNGSRK